MEIIDFAPATKAVAEVVSGIRDDQLTAPTPCPDYTVAHLLDHVAGLSAAFTDAARKEGGPGPGGTGDATQLADDWRESIPAALDRLAQAWRDPTAYAGTTSAGPIEMPAAAAAL